MSSQSSNYPASSTASVPAPSSAASDVERIETLQRIEKVENASETALVHVGRLY